MTDAPSKPRTLAEIEAEIPAWQKASEHKKRVAWQRAVRTNTRHVNNYLYEMGRAYHVSVPLDEVNTVLKTYGFDELEAIILCGREGRIHENVGHNRWLSLTWYKMDSGRYEVVAYVS